MILFFLFFYSIFNLFTLYASDLQLPTARFESEVPKADKVFSGYIKADYYVDTRHVVGLRSDHVLLFPRAPLLDVQGEDVNARPQLTMISIESRMRYTRTSDNIEKIGCKARGFIEFDFWGRNPIEISDIGGYCRLRHSVIELEFERAILTFGHTWHPFSVIDCYPDTLSFNSGWPYAASARNGGFVATLKFCNTQLILGAFSQLLFNNDGPIGFSNRYIRDGCMPDFHIQVRYNDNTHLFGVCYNVKRLAPRLVTDKNFVTHERIYSQAASIFYSYAHPVFSFRMRYVFIQNGTEFGFFGGYGVHNIDPITDKRTYANTATSNFWWDMDIHLNDYIFPGLFVGYMFNHGSFKKILPDVIDDDILVERRFYGYDDRVGQSVRVEPRVRLQYNPVVFGFELEMTAASFGKPNEYKKVKNATWEKNVRFAISAIYIY